MSSSRILQTKLHIPQVRPNIVPRPRLLAKLNAGLHGSLILVSAPAGYGKTTLVAEWLSSFISSPLLPVDGAGVRVAWLSLDESDNDLSRFFACLLAALRQVQPEIGRAVEAMLQSPGMPSAEMMITTFLEEWNATQSHTLLVLDDYHNITSLNVHESLDRLLLHLPPSLHLVIVTRADPPLPLARLRVRNQMVEIRANDLCFTLDEVNAFLSRTMGLFLSPDQVAALETRTEGWVAGLQLAALSIQGRENANDFVNGFTGGHHYIADYLVEDVLNRQPEPVRDFLLKTSILGRMNALLCNALTESSDGQFMLEELERANLFVVALDDERSWYRYHRLFADVLRKYLTAKLPGQLHRLHGLASEWYRLNGYPVDAFHHATNSGDLAQAANIVEENAWSMVLQGQLSNLDHWIRSLPAEVTVRRPRLCIHHAWALLFSGDSGGAEQQLHVAESFFGADPATGMPVDLQGHTYAIRAWMMYQKGDLQEAVALSRLAVELVPDLDPAVRCLLAGILGQGCISEYQITEAARHYSDMVNLARVSGNIMLEVGALCALGWLSELMGRLQEAGAIYQDAIQKALEFKSPSAGQAYLNLANLYRERNDLAAARQNAEMAIEFSRAWGHVDALATGFLYLARINQAGGDLPAVMMNLNEMDNTICGHVLEPPTLILLEAMRARLYLAQGHIERARQWAKERGLTIHDHLDYFSEVEYVTLAQVFIAEKKLDAAEQLLERLHKVIEASGRYGNLIEILTLQSLVFDMQGKSDIALATLEKAVTLAALEEYMCVFLDQGTPLEKLLKRLRVENTTLKSHIRKLLNAFGCLESFSPPTASRPQTLIEPLSDRELDILRRVALGRSNRQIADELFLATGTVKKHLNNIFGKLNVQNRTECVARARELNLL